MKLPMKLPKPCPICAKDVYLQCVTEWTRDDDKIIGFEIECESEPDLFSDEWEEWHDDHYQMPYVDWIPYEKRLKTWLNKNFRYDDQTKELIEVLG